MAQRDNDDVIQIEQLTDKCRKLQEEIEGLNRRLDSKDKMLQGKIMVTKSQEEDKEKLFQDIDDLVKNTNDLKAHYQKKIDVLKAQYQKEIDDLKAQYQKEIDDAKECKRSIENTSSQSGSGGRNGARVRSPSSTDNQRVTRSVSRNASREKARSS